MLYSVSLIVSVSIDVLNRSGDVVNVDVIFREVNHRTYSDGVLEQQGDVFV